MSAFLPCSRLLIAGLAVLALAGCASPPPLSLPTIGTALPDPANASTTYAAGAVPAHDLIGAVALQIIQAPLSTEATSSLLVFPLHNVTGRPLDIAGLSAALSRALTATGRFTLIQLPAPPSATLSASREQRLLTARASGARYFVQGVLELEEAQPATAGTVTLRVEVTDLTTSLVVWMVRQTGMLPATTPNPAP